MTFSQALHTIHKHWQVLPHERKASHEAVWIRIPPTDETSEGDEEWIGMRGDGSLVWAYASGFVPRESNPETASRQEVQVWEFDRKDMPKPWKEALITFAETSCDHDVSIATTAAEGDRKSNKPASRAKR